MKWPLMGIGLIVMAACVQQPAAKSANEIPGVSAPKQANPLIRDQAPLIVWDSGLRSYQLHLVDPASGEPAPGLGPIPLYGGFDYRPAIALAPNGSRLAAFTGRGPACEAYAGGSACRASASQLQWIDLLTWEERTYQFPFKLPSQVWVGPVAFSPDGSLLAAAYHDRDGSGLLLLDEQRSELRGPTPLDLRPSTMAFSSDLSSLVIFGAPQSDIPGISPPEPPHVLLVDLATLAVEWDRTMPDILDGSWCLENCAELHSSGERSVFAYYEPGVAFSDLRDQLYILHADSDRLTTVDIQSRQVADLEIRPEGASWVERLLSLLAHRAQAKGYLHGATKRALLSPDGSKLFWIGQSWNAQVAAEGGERAEGLPLGLHMIDLDSRREVAVLEIPAETIRISSDGKLLILSRWDASTPQDIFTDLVSSQNFEKVATVAGWDILPALSPAGRPTYLAFGLTGSADEETPLGSWDPLSLELLIPWTWAGLAFWGASP